MTHSSPACRHQFHDFRNGLRSDVRTHTALSQPKWIGIALAGQQRRGLVQRQADDVGVGADDLDDERCRRAPAPRSRRPCRAIRRRRDRPRCRCSDSRLKRTRVSISRWRNASFGVTRQIAGVDAMVAAGEQPQALRRLVEQVGLRQDAAADRHHRVGGEDVGAGQLVVELHRRERRLRLAARQAVGAGARQLAPLAASRRCRPGAARPARCRSG